MAVLDPTKTRLSSHFLLSDMMGCASVYSSGLPNVFDKAPGKDIRLENGKALCEQVLEPILALSGSISISYGFISPSLSQEIVSYQDPRKPSHHRWDLGAAVDVCVHHHVLQSTANHATPESGAPILYALEHLSTLPLSRLITYSESPYICLAVSADEVAAGAPRGAWYENRYTGKAKAKPRYMKYPNPGSRTRALSELCDCGLDHGWEGGGFPSYHGGGRRRLHHMRVSNYTVVSDWLFDEEFVREGVRNIPSLGNSVVVEGFSTAGHAYDYLLKVTGYPRLSIVSGYTSHLSPGWIDGRDWRDPNGSISFEIVPPEYCTPEEFIQATLAGDADAKMFMIFGNLQLLADDDRVIVTVRRGTKWPE